MLAHIYFCCSIVPKMLLCYMEWEHCGPNPRACKYFGCRPLYKFC